MRKLFWVLGGLAVVLWWLHGLPQGGPARQRIDWSADPVQVDADVHGPTFERVTSHGKVTFHPRATFEASGVAASAEHYLLDPVAFLSPVDVVLTWGHLPESPYKEKISYSQMTRYYFWRTRATDLDLTYISRHSANMHLLPSNANLKKAVAKIGSGDAVRISGLLVDLVTDRGLYWNTSMTRDDTGPGACEVIWVQELQIGNRVYR